ncbi:male sterility domain-containing protein, putative [Pediculus humanus corporis]|uniref:Fatty acyl-CoA reductase n=1 Tax=Pediculus humanus subsp. corporis TaxID=121224 RepID=E0VSV6_PEDHC|nr:male sterility domain-containing protein, putative [Pediculus humanus corporis]EEB16462.1 male sterility domain-containing protein, putative [Pediculus humanus corporis]
MSDPNNIGSDIISFYRGKSIFVTGGTGLMGKVLVEKLLRTCPGINKIYLLMRPKKGNDVNTRLSELINTRIFDGIRKTHPETMSKLISVAGDITAPNLGLNSSDVKILTENVSIVFHSAATVKFDESLKESVAMNMNGTKSVVQLCQKMKNLEALVHVSTAYCNCDKEDISEVIYPPPDDPEKIMKCVECMDKELLENITPQIIRSRPNTYTFTKALAEHIVLKEGVGLPVAIVRPSIVTAAWKEPLPGWIDNLNGPTGLLAGAGKGILRTLLCYRELIADLIPVDIAINLLVTVAWHTAQTRPDNVPVYNCTSGGLNPIRWMDVETWGHSSLTTLPFNDVIWYPGGSFKSSKIINILCQSFFHFIPAYLIDTVSVLIGRKPMMVRVQKKFKKAISVLEFFTTHEWKFHSTNVRNLLLKLNEHDRKLFNFDVKQVNWKKYIDNYVEGIRLYILKEDPESSHKAKINLRKMYVLHKMTQILSLLFLIKILIGSKMEIVRKMWTSLWTISLYLARFISNSIRF